MRMLEYLHGCLEQCVFNMEYTPNETQLAKELCFLLDPIHNHEGTLERFIGVLYKMSKEKDEPIKEILRDISKKMDTELASKRINPDPNLFADQGEPVKLIPPVSE